PRGCGRGRPPRPMAHSTSWRRTTSGSSTARSRRADSKSCPCRSSTPTSCITSGAGPSRPSIYAVKPWATERSTEGGDAIGEEEGHEEEEEVGRIDDAVNLATRGGETLDEEEGQEEEEVATLFSFWVGGGCLPP